MIENHAKINISGVYLGYIRERGIPKGVTKLPGRDVDRGLGPDGVFFFPLTARMTTHPLAAVTHPWPRPTPGRFLRFCTKSTSFVFLLAARMSTHHWPRPTPDHYVYIIA